MAAGESPGWRQLPQSEETRAWTVVAHGLRISTVSEYRRVLESQDGDVHAAGRHLHPTLRILRGAEGATRGNRLGRATACGGSRRDPGLETRGRHQREPR